MKEEVLTKVLNAKADSSKNEEIESKKKAMAKGNVTVCCGIPMGLKLIRNNGDAVILNGMPMSHIVAAEQGKGFLPMGKFGSTILPAEVWEELHAKYKNFDFIQNGTVFAKADYQEAEEVAKERSQKKLGFEQANPKKGKTKKANSED